MKSLISPLILSALFLTGCTWVKPSDEAKGVTLVKEMNTQGCKKLGQTQVQVRNTLIGGLERDQEKVQEELTTLAKNQAAKMGGDSIVSQENLKDGTLGFDIYKCAE